MQLFGDFENTSIKDIERSVSTELLTEMRHMIKIQMGDMSFWIMKYQVTQLLWESVTGNNPSLHIGSSRPVEQVSWLDCVLFANELSEKEGLEKVYEIPEGMEKACREQTEVWDTEIGGYALDVKIKESANGYRLPTEAEWEYAAKGGEDYKYAGSDDLHEVGWSNHNSDSQTHAVGQKKANGYGLYDMSGNVTEWCFDAYESNLRILRGGSWCRHADNCEVSNRYWFFVALRDCYMGLRMVRNA